MLTALLAALSAPASTVASPSHSSAVELGPIRAQLFYAFSGRLSDDVLDRKEPFVFWNTIIGEGQADEPADDVLVSVKLDSGKFGTPEENEQNISSPVTLSATDAKGRLIAKRTFTDILTSKTGTVTLPLLLQDVTCSGDVKVKAVFQNQMSSALLSMHCGE
jgi:hypothetical protein